MSFINKNLQQSSRKGMSFMKGATFFFLGMSVFMLVSKAAIEILPSSSNLVNVLGKSIMTVDGNPLSAQNIVLDGGSGDAYFAGTVTGTTICLLGDSCRTTWPQGALPQGNNSTIQFKDGTSFSGSSSFVWDNVNGYLGVGISTPNYELDVDGSGRISNGLYFGSLIGGLGENAKIYNQTLIGINHLKIKGSTSPLSPSDGGSIRIDGGIPNGGDYGNIILADDGGNVGIGTTTPGAKLDIDGNILLTNNGSDRSIKMADYGTPKSLSILGSTPNIGSSGIGGRGGAIKIKAGSGGLGATFGGDGGSVYINGGIGGNGPSHGTEGNIGNVVLASEGGRVNIGNNLNLYTDVDGYIDSLSNLNFITNGTTKMIINTAGYVGIGTTPTEKLHVAGGTAKFNEAIQIGYKRGRCNSTGDVGKIVYVNTCYHTGVNNIYTPAFIGCIGSGSAGRDDKVFMTGASWTVSGAMCSIIFDEEISSELVGLGSLRQR